jgi:hypothetical protein
MNETERKIRRELLLTEELIESWYPWHCHDWFCEHHMCRVRNQNLNKLRFNLMKLNVKWKVTKELKRRSRF